MVQQLVPTVRATIPAIHIFETLPSTNEWLLEQDQTCGHVCLAEQQSAGRGRRGRVWESPPSGNIYFSLRWCFAEIPKHYAWLGLVVGVAVAEALADYGLRHHQIKWPNDVYVDGKKLAGILLQTAQPLQQVVIGIGINTGMSAHQTPMDQAWCDLGQLLAHTIDRNRLIALLLNRLVPSLQQFLHFNQPDFLKQWQRWDYLANKSVNIFNNNQQLQGLVLGLDAQGQLSVRLNSGETQSFSSADISVRTA